MVMSTERYGARRRQFKELNSQKASRSSWYLQTEIPSQKPDLTGDSGIITLDGSISAKLHILALGKA